LLKKSLAMAGAKFNAAEPEVQINTTGFLSCCAIPKAIKAADLSSGIILQEIASFLAKAMVKGALLDPGQIMALVIPNWAHIDGMLKMLG
jgi:hypothetical protein